MSLMYRNGSANKITEIITTNPHTHTKLRYTKLRHAKSKLSEKDIDEFLAQLAKIEKELDEFEREQEKTFNESDLDNIRHKKDNDLERRKKEIEKMESKKANYHVLHFDQKNSISGDRFLERFGARS